MKQLKDILGEGPTPMTLSSAAATTSASVDEGVCPTCQGARFVRVTSDPHDPRFGRPEPCE